MRPYTMLARWMLCWMDRSGRVKRLAWHDSRGEGDAVREALTAQHEAWSHLPTIEKRRAAYAKAMRAAKEWEEAAALMQANERDQAAMKRLAGARAEP